MHQRNGVLSPLSADPSPVPHGECRYSWVPDLMPASRKLQRSEATFSQSTTHSCFKLTDVSLTDCSSNRTTPCRELMTTVKARLPSRQTTFHSTLSISR